MFPLNFEAVASEFKGNIEANTYSYKKVYQEYFFEGDSVRSSCVLKVG